MTKKMALSYLFALVSAIGVTALGHEVFMEADSTAYAMPAKTKTAANPPQGGSDKYFYEDPSIPDRDRSKGDQEMFALVEFGITFEPEAKDLPRDEITCTTLQMAAGAVYENDNIIAPKCQNEEYGLTAGTLLAGGALARYERAKNSSYLGLFGLTYDNLLIGDICALTNMGMIAGVIAMQDELKIPRLDKETNIVMDTVQNLNRVLDQNMNKCADLGPFYINDGHAWRAVANEVLVQPYYNNVIGIPAAASTNAPRYADDAYFQKDENAPARLADKKGFEYANLILTGIKSTPSDEVLKTRPDRVCLSWRVATKNTYKQDVVDDKCTNEHRRTTVEIVRMGSAIGEQLGAKGGLNARFEDFAATDYCAALKIAMLAAVADVYQEGGRTIRDRQNGREVPNRDVAEELVDQALVECAQKGPYKLPNSQIWRNAAERVYLTRFFGPAPRR